jgi:hypothetical protein
MTLLRRLVEGDIAIVAGLVDEDGGYQHAVNFEDPCTKAVKFDVQVAADIYWRGTNDSYDISRLGPLKLPFDDVWMEWSVPSGSLINQDEDLMTELVGMRCGAYLQVTDNGFCVVMLAINPETEEMFLWPTVEHVTLDGQGNYVSAEALPKFPDMTDQLIQQSAAMVRMFTLPAFMALGLTNCRNVKTAETGSVRMRRSGREKRQGVPPKELRYSTIILPGGGSIASDKRGGSHRAAAVHRVRGHFKTFTAERPLLGKHVGTYWWGWNVRGNPEHGEVQSDYEMGARA